MVYAVPNVTPEAEPFPVLLTCNFNLESQLISDCETLTSHELGPLLQEKNGTTMAARPHQYFDWPLHL